MYDIQLSERNIVTEKSKHLGQGVFDSLYNKITVIQMHREFKASGSHSFIHSFIHIRLINIRNAA